MQIHVAMNGVLGVLDDAAKRVTKQVAKNQRRSRQDVRRGNIFGSIALGVFSSLVLDIEVWSSESFMIDHLGKS